MKILLLIPLLAAGCAGFNNPENQVRFYHQLDEMDQQNHEFFMQQSKALSAPIQPYFIPPLNQPSSIYIFPSGH